MLIQDIHNFIKHNSVTKNIFNFYTYQAYFYILKENQSLSGNKVSPTCYDALWGLMVEFHWPFPNHHASQVSCTQSSLKAVCIP